MKTTRQLLSTTAAALLLVILPCGCSKTDRAEKKVKTATEHFDKGEYPAAEIEFKNALKLDAGNPAALKGLGLVLARQGAMFDAGRILSEAKTKLPTDDEIGVNLALAMLDLGFVPASRKELLEVLTRTPAHGEALMLLAETSATQEAMTECEERIALAESPDKTAILLASALIDLRRGKSEVGTAKVSRVLEVDPESARAHALKGSIFKEDKQVEKALESLKKASDLAGPRSVERCSYAKFLIGLNRQDEAAALLKQSTAEAPDYLPNFRILARIAFTSGQTAEAAEYLAKVLGKSPLDIDAGMLQALLWLSKNEPSKAVEQLETLTKAFPARPVLELALAKAYLATNDFLKAAEMLDHVLVNAPGATEAVLLRAGLFLKGNQPAEVIRLVEPLYAVEPTNRTAQELLVAAYRAANRPDDAVALLKRQAEAAPNEVGPLLELGQLLGTQGKAAEARAIFERAQTLAPDHIAAVSQLVALDQREGKGDAAMARIDAFLGAHPQDSQAHLLKAGLCFVRKDYKTSESLASKAIELKPDEPAAYGLLVRIQVIEGRLEEAVARLKQLLEVSPKNLSARMYLGSLLRELGRTDEARACFEEIIKIDPKFASAYNDLAYIDSLAPGKLDQALEFARTARTLLPNDPAVADTYGWIEWLRGEYRQALPLLLQAAVRLPSMATVQYHLAMTHYMMGQTEEAIAAFEKALATPGGFPEKDEATAHLAILREGDKWDLAALEQRLKDSPKDPVLMVLKARKLAGTGHPDDALAAYQNALATNPDLEAAHLGMAELYAGALKQPDKALDAANQARKIAPQSARVAAVLGKMEFDHGRHPEAYRLLQEAALKLPADTAVQADFARAAYSVGRVADARTAMAKLASADPALAAEVKDFLALTDPNAAADAGTPALVEKRLAASPTDVPALMARAALQEKAGESPVAGYEKVLEVYPQFDPARIALARVFLDDPKQLEAAEKLANAARERLANDPDLSGILALINFRKGQFDYAAQLLKELSVKRPLSGRELFALGMSQAATKRPEEAQQTLTKALQAQLPEADAAKAKATLEELNKQLGKGK